MGIALKYRATRCLGAAHETGVFFFFFDRCFLNEEFEFTDGVKTTDD